MNHNYRSSVVKIPSMRYHANDWGIISKNEKEFERRDGLAFLSSSLFSGRCIEHYYFYGYEVLQLADKINAILINRWFYVVINDSNFNRTILLINQVSSLISHINISGIYENIDDYTFTFLLRVGECDECCAGVVLSDGKGKIRIEIKPDSVNTRDLTEGSTTKDSLIFMENEYHSLKYICGQNHTYKTSCGFSYLVVELIRSCYKTRGYYEFIFGLNQIYSFPILFFTYYSDNSKYGI